MTNKTDWETQSTNLLKAELARRGIGYEQLRIALANIGINKSIGSLTVSINRGKFSFAFFLQCAKAIGSDKLQLS